MAKKGELRLGALFFDETHIFFVLEKTWVEHHKGPLAVMTQKKRGQKDPSLDGRQSLFRIFQEKRNFKLVPRYADGKLAIHELD